MKRLNEMKWEEFFLEDVFTISSSVRLTKEEMTNGTRPFVGASNSNNGVTAFVGNTNTSLDKNVLGVNYNGSVVESFYHPYEAIFSDDVKRLHIRGRQDNKYVLLFIKQLILKQKCKYEYGYKFNGERMKRQKIMLPVSAPHTPDYVYMEEYMRSKEKDMLTKYKHYLEKHSAERIADELCLDSRRWKDFPLTDIFALNSTSSSIDKCKLNGQEGDYPYITRSETNNGWNSLIGKQDDYKLDDGNVISLGLDTQTVFYQHIPFYTGQNIQVLSSEYLNKYVALFIKPLLVIQMRNLNWGGNGATLGRLNKLKIMLPVTSSSIPDYDFMSKYMKNIEMKQLKEYIDKRLGGFR